MRKKTQNLPVQLLGGWGVARGFYEGQEGDTFTFEQPNKKQLCLVSLLTSVVNREMPIAARST